jgi:hypothetical protein
MGNTVDVTNLSDAELAEQILSRKFLSSAQLKIALDYQVSVGGRLASVISKLGLVRDGQLEAFLERVGNGEEFTWGEDPDPEPSKKHEVPDFQVDKLRVHKKLIDKVPSEVVEKYGILFFFPPPKTRAILLSSSPDIGAVGVRKLEGLLGVEICPVELSEADRARFLTKNASAHGGGSAAPLAAAAPIEPTNGPAAPAHGLPSHAHGAAAQAPAATAQPQGASKEATAQPQGASKEGASPSSGPAPEAPSAAPRVAERRDGARTPPSTEGLGAMVESVRKKGGDAERGAANTFERKREEPSVVVAEATGGASRSLASHSIVSTDALGELFQGADEKTLVRALGQLLLKKGLVEIDEIAVEIQLAKRKSRR